MCGWKVGRDRRSGSQDTARCNQAQHRDARRRRYVPASPGARYRGHRRMALGGAQLQRRCLGERHDRTPDDAIQRPTRSPSSTPTTSRSPTTGDHKVLTIGTADAAETFVLVQRGTEPPALEGDLTGATVIEVPIETMFSESSSHYGFIDVLDIEATVTGVGDTSLIVTPSLAERAAAGEIESFARNFVDRPRGRRGRRSRRLRHRRSDDPSARGDQRRRHSRGAQRRVAGDDPRRAGRSGSACSPP